MTEPEEMPRDPDLDVLPLVQYAFLPTPWLGAEGVGYGVRVVLERSDGERLVAGVDSPEAALALAHDLARAARDAHAMREAARGPQEPETIEYEAEVRQPRPLPYLLSKTEAAKAYDPKTCSGCGVVEGARFEPRHHPPDCPALIAHHTEPETP